MADKYKLQVHGNHRRIRDTYNGERINLPPFVGLADARRLLKLLNRGYNIVKEARRDARANS